MTGPICARIAKDTFKFWRSNLAGFLDIPEILTFSILAFAAILLLYRQDLRQNNLRIPSDDCFDSRPPPICYLCLFIADLAIKRRLFVKPPILTVFLSSKFLTIVRNR